MPDSSENKDNLLGILYASQSNIRFMWINYYNKPVINLVQAFVLASVAI